METRWIALYSQTGKELREICKQLGREPDIVLTDNAEADVHTMPGMYSGYRDRVDLMQSLKRGLWKGDLVTLHGYLGIIPATVLETGARFLNGHPGLISEYPELKGLDPQKRYFAEQDKYSQVGCVIHEVTTEIDSGKIVATAAIPVEARYETLEDVIETIKTMSVGLWVDVLRRYLH